MKLFIVMASVFAGNMLGYVEAATFTPERTLLAKVLWSAIPMAIAMLADWAIDKDRK